MSDKKREWICPKCKTTIVKATGNTNVEAVILEVRCKTCGSRPIRKKEKLQEISND